LQKARICTSSFKRQGYQKVDKDDMAVLLWMPFTDDAVPPKWIRQKQQPQTIAGKITVTELCNG
jgi:hypothetical protein